MAVRRREVCNGGPSACPSVREAECSACGSKCSAGERNPVCPACGKRKLTYVRCDGCKIPKIDEALIGSQAGALLSAAVEIKELSQFAKLDLDDMNMLEWHAVKVLTEAEESYREEVRSRPK